MPSFLSLEPPSLSANRCKTLHKGLHLRTRSVPGPYPLHPQVPPDGEGTEVVPCGSCAGVVHFIRSSFPTGEEMVETEEKYFFFTDSFCMLFFINLIILRIIN